MVSSPGRGWDRLSVSSPRIGTKSRRWAGCWNGFRWSSGSTRLRWACRGWGSSRVSAGLTMLAWDAAARYRDGWAAFFWSGVMQRESRVKETFTKLGEDLAYYSVLGPDPYPGFLCFVVGDPWQREVVFRVAREFGCTEVLRVWCVSDGTVAGGPGNPGRSRGWVQQLPLPAGTWAAGVGNERVADCVLVEAVGLWGHPVVGIGGRVAGDDIQVREGTVSGVREFPVGAAAVQAASTRRG